MDVRLLTFKLIKIAVHKNRARRVFHTAAARLRSRKSEENTGVRNFFFHLNIIQTKRTYTFTVETSCWRYCERTFCAAWNTVRSIVFTFCINYCAELRTYNERTAINRQRVQFFNIIYCTPLWFMWVLFILIITMHA